MQERGLRTSTGHSTASTDCRAAGAVPATGTLSCQEPLLEPPLPGLPEQQMGLSKEQVQRAAKPLTQCHTPWVCLGKWVQSFESLVLEKISALIFIPTVGLLSLLGDTELSLLCSDLQETLDT